MDARSTARSWTRPYSSVQAAWVMALGIQPSEVWVDRGEHPRRHRYRGAPRLMAQRHGVRGL